MTAKWLRLLIRVGAVSALLVPAISDTAAGAAPQQARAPLAVEPLGSRGEAIYPAFEGWGPHKDGTTVFLLGYYNRNKSAIEVPIGPENRIEPEGPDYGQPTHFEPGRQYGTFSIRIPKDFGTRKLTWTLSVNGQSSTVSFWTNPPYYLDFFQNLANGDQTPSAQLSVTGPWFTGPPLGIAATRTVVVGQPLELLVRASDRPASVVDIEAELSARTRIQPAATDQPLAFVGRQLVGARGRAAGTRETPADITVSWHRDRGPAAVAFEPARVHLTTNGDPEKIVEARSNAIFTAPGDYLLRAQINDKSGDGGGGLQCCWTTVLIKVTVR